MKCLGFSEQSVRLGARRIRTMRFEERSMLPASAACVVANGVRETLAALYGAPLHVRLFEPVIPSPQAWAAIANDALLYRMRGTRADAVVVIRPRDAVTLASFAFGEKCSDARALSPIERTVLDRAVRAIAGTCAPVCGVSADAPAIEAVTAISGFITYIELQLERPIQGRIGIALSRDPQPDARSEIRLDDLLDLQLELAVRTAPAQMSAAEVATLEPRAIVPMTKERVVRGTLYLAGRPLQTGECGVRDGRFAMAIEPAAHDERNPEGQS